MTISRNTPPTRALRAAVARRAAALALTVVLVGCSAPAPAPAPAPASHTPSAPPSSTILSVYGWEDMGANHIIDFLDALPISERPEGLMASIRPYELLLTDDVHPDVTLPMPAEEFYVSIAPYVDQTHECHFHSLTTCTGELFDEEVDLTVTDAATGEVIVEETLRTQGNGFLGLWLPRDIDATIEVSQGSRSASTSISTAGDDVPTCLTTMQLA